MHFAENLKHLRKKHNLDQAQIAKLLGLKPATVSAYETGRIEPKLDALQKLSATFGISIDDLICHNLSVGSVGSKRPALPNSLRVAALANAQELQQQLKKLTKLADDILNYLQ